MSFETACFNGYAEELLEVQMADVVPLKLFTDNTLQGIEREDRWLVVFMISALGELWKNLFFKVCQHFY